MLLSATPRKDAIPLLRKGLAEIVKTGWYERVILAALAKDRDTIPSLQRYRTVTVGAYSDEFVQ